MRKLLVSLWLFFVTVINVHAANYYWVGGTGNWNDLTKWAASSGGTGGVYGQIPQSTDDVFFDVNSFTANNQIVTINVAPTCGSMNWTGATSVFTGATLRSASFSLDIFGSLTLASGMGNLDFANSRFLRFVSSATGNTINMAGVNFVNRSTTTGIQINGAGSWNLASDISVDRNIEILRGTLNTNNFYVRCLILTSTGSNVRALNLGSSLVEIGTTAAANTINTTGGTSPRFEYTGSNFTFNAGTSTVAVMQANTLGGAVLIRPNGLTLNRLVLESSNTNIYYNFQSRFTAKTVSVYGVAAIDSNFTVTDSLRLRGGTYFVMSGANRRVILADTADLHLETIATCSRRFTHLTGLLGASIHRNSGWGTYTAEYTALDSIAFTGGGNATFNNSLDLGGNANVIVNAPTARNLYWIGGTGDWNNPARWSLTNGGVGGECPPTAADNVFFTSASFTANSQTVRVNEALPQCNNITWSAVGRTNIDISRTTTINTTLNIYGSIVYHSSMRNTYDGFHTYWGNGVHTISCNTKTVRGETRQRGRGEYRLVDNFLGGTNYIYRVWRGTFRTMNYDFTIGGLYTDGVGLKRVFLGKSNVYLRRTGNSSCLYFENNNLVFNAGTSNIYIQHQNTEQANIFSRNVGLSNISFYNLSFTNSSATARISADQASVDITYTFNRLKLYSTSSTEQSIVVRDSLWLNSGEAHTFTGGRIVELTDTADLVADGNCDKIVILTSSNTTPFVFSKPAGIGSVLLDNVNLSYITATGGANFTATNANANNITGITISGQIARKLYWVGGSGNWTDTNKWAATTAGVTGECPPSSIDSVFFDANSFTGTGQTVTVPANTSVQIRYMDWTGAGFNPTFTAPNTSPLSMTGSLKLIRNMTFNYDAAVTFTGTGGTSHSITSNGKRFIRDVIINSPGSTYILADTFRVMNTAINIGFTFTAGTLTFGTNYAEINRFASNNNLTRVLNLGSGTIYVNRSLANNVGNDWTYSGSNLTLNAATSKLMFSGGTTVAPFNFVSATNLQYYKLVTNVSTEPTYVSTSLGNNIRYNILELRKNVTVTGSNSISDTLRLLPGGNYTFNTGTTQTLGNSCYAAVQGNGSQSINIQSNVTGQTFTWFKNMGIVCTDYVYLRDSNVNGTAYFTGGNNANNQSGNDVCGTAGTPGCWDFSQYAALGTVSLYSGCNSTTDSLRFLITGSLPKEIKITKDNGAGVFDTITYTANSLNTVPTGNANEYTFKMPADTVLRAAPLKTKIRILSFAVLRCDVTVGTSSSILTYGYLPKGTVGQYTGTFGNNWFDCGNWGNLGVPDSTVNVTIPAGKSVLVSNDSSTVFGKRAKLRNLTIANTAVLDFAQNETPMFVYGNIANSGTMDNTQGRVRLEGTGTQTLSGVTSFGDLWINKPSGNIQLAGTVNVADTLRLLSGNININNQNILLGTTGKLVGETETARIFDANTAAGGYIEAQGNFVASANNHLGNLGLVVNPANGKTGVIVRRGYDYQSNYKGNKSINRFYDVQNAAAPLNATVRFSYLNAEIFGDNVGQESLFQLWRSPDAGTNWYLINAVATPASKYVETTGFVGFSYVTVSSDPVEPLPVTLLSFDGTHKGTHVALQWVTASEQNSSHFELEKSADGKNFTQIANLKAAGTSSSKQYYQHDDYKPFLGVNYYRLKQIDNDGKYEYSSVIAVRKDGKGESIKIYPNPNEGEFTINNPQGEIMTVVVRDVTGRELNSYQLADYKNQLNMKHLSKGMYFLHISTETGSVQTEKLVIE